MQNAFYLFIYNFIQIDIFNLFGYSMLNILFFSFYLCELETGVLLFFLKNKVYEFHNLQNIFLNYEWSIVIMFPNK